MNNIFNVGGRQPVTHTYDPSDLHMTPVTYIWPQWPTYDPSALSPVAGDALVPVVSEGQGHVEDLSHYIPDELDLLVQETSLVDAAHVAGVHRYHEVQVVRFSHLTLELQPGAV